MSEVLIRQTIVAELERAKAAWNAVLGNYSLLMDYENFDGVDLAQQVNPYVAVDIVFRDTTQLDLGQRPILRDDGQIMLAVGVKEKTGTLQAAAVRDFFLPYLNLRDNLTNGVRTHEAKKYPPTRLTGFYYLSMVVGFWCDGVSPVTP